MFFFFFLNKLSDKEFERVSIVFPDLEIIIKRVLLNFFF